MVDRILGLQERRPLLLREDLNFQFDQRWKVTANRWPPGYQRVTIGNRLQLHTVCMLSQLGISMIHYFQVLPLPRLGRADGHKLLEAATGTFTVRKGNGVITNMRIVEIRDSREANLTGDIALYNQLASLLPQETFIWYQR